MPPPTTLTRRLTRPLTRRKRWVALALGLLILPVLHSCSGVIGHAIVSPPNAGQSRDDLRPEHDADPAPEPAGTVIDQRLYLDLPAHSQPNAKPVSLSAWIIDPSNEQLIDDDRGTVFQTPDNTPRTRTAPTAGTLLILPGYYHDKNRYPYLLWARVFAQHGYRSILLDARGHGGSTGDTTTFGAQEAHDLVEAVTQLQSQNLIVGKLGVFGNSKGSVTAIRHAALDPRVEAVVSVAAFARFTDVVPSFSRGLFGWLVPLRWLINEDAIVRNALATGGFAPQESDAVHAIASTHAPVLLLHSQNDRHVPPQHALTIAAANPAMTTLLLIDGPGHFSFGVTDTAPLRDAAIQHFNTHLKTHPEPHPKPDALASP